MPHTHRISIALTLAAICLPILVGCAHPNVWVEAERHIELPVESSKQLDVHSENGSIHVFGKDAGTDKDPTITMTVRIRAGGRDRIEADACLNAIEIDTAPLATGHQSVRTTWSRPQRSDWAARVSYEVHMPGRLALHATTDNGIVEVRNVGGECVLETDNGRIEVRGGRGRLRTRTSNGRIDVETSAPDVDLRSNNGPILATLTANGPVAGRITSDNGRVRVFFGERTSALVIAGTQNGSIRTRSLDLTELHSSRNHLSGKLGDGGGQLRVRTANGRVILGTLETGRSPSHTAASRQ